MRAFKVESPASCRLAHFSPLRYPGGKGKLAAYIKELMRENRLLDGEYAEPYAGGAAIAVELLLQDYASRIHINDLSRAIFAFWYTVLFETESLCRLIRDTPMTLEAWDAQKRIFAAPEAHDQTSLGFATFFLNRTNRSGILNGGIIGGREQTGAWKIDARFNRRELIYRIESIARLGRRISLTRMDALEFLRLGLQKWPEKTLIYLDPPYFAKGRDLYYDYYKPKDHEEVAKFVTHKLMHQRWVVSYDSAPEIQSLYQGHKSLLYDIGYSARLSSRVGREVMFFSNSLEVCPLVGPFKIVQGAVTTATNNASGPECTHRTLSTAFRSGRKAKSNRKSS